MSIWECPERDGADAKHCPAENPNLSGFAEMQVRQGELQILDLNIKDK